MGRAFAGRPKSLTLAYLLWHHRPALAYDWRARFGASLDEVTERRIPWGEAWDLTSEILRDPWSHTLSALRHDVYVPHPVQAATADLFEGWVNAKRARGTIPFKAPRPWEGKGSTPAGPATRTRFDPARHARRQKLRERLRLVDGGKG